MSVRGMNESLAEVARLMSDEVAQMRDGENKETSQQRSDRYDWEQQIKMTDKYHELDGEPTGKSYIKREGFITPAPNPFDPPEWPYDGRCDGARPTVPLPGNPLLPTPENHNPLDPPIIIPTIWPVDPFGKEVEKKVEHETDDEAKDRFEKAITRMQAEHDKRGKTSSAKPLTGKETNPKDAVGIQKWRQYCTVPTTIIWELGVAMLEGARKYGRHNYRVAGVRASVYVDAAKGHIDQWWEGEDIDEESKLNHLTKAMASLAVLRDAMICDRWVDDRPPKVPMAKIKADLQAAVDSIFKRIPVAKDAYLEGDQYDNKTE